MIKYDTALKNVLENAHLLATEKVRIEDSVGRILKEDVYSKVEMPPFDKSAVDGYAVRSTDVRKAPTLLKRVGLIQAGENLKKRLKKGECAKIMTGAPLPKGADSVIMVEDTHARDNHVSALKAVKRWENVCFRAEDIRRGRRVLEKETGILPSHIAVLAAVGKEFVNVTAKPGVAILNTGGEIVPVGRALGGNKIYNSNGPMLQTLLKSDGMEPSFLGIAKDDTNELTRMIKQGLKANALLISGGVSMGDYDLVPQVLKNLGVRKIFHKVNIKPGKPLFFGKVRKTVIFGIPGNPVSNFLAYFLFIRPALRKMMGHGEADPLFKEGIVDEEYGSKVGRRHFVLVTIYRKNGCYHLRPVLSHGSADILALSAADGFMGLNENAGVIKKGSKAQFITWKEI